MSVGTSIKRGGLALLLTTVLAVALATAQASAEIGPELVRFGEHGSGAGQLNTFSLGGIATSPDTGHLFVTEQGNNRISEFTAWGEFVKAWGWGVRDGSAELQSCTEQTGCQAGLSGTGPGQFESPAGIAVDPSGNVYVFEAGIWNTESEPSHDQRIQKFSPAGEFIWMVGGEVNEATGANLCTKADDEAGDVCGGGNPGTGAGEFSRHEMGFTRRDNLDIGPDNLLYVADQGRIQSFDLNGTFQGELPFSTIQASNSQFPAAGSSEIGSLAIDPLSGDFLMVFPNPAKSSASANAWRVKPSGTVVQPAPLVTSDLSAPERFFPEAVATDAQGSAYLSLSPAFQSRPSHDVRAWQLDAAGAKTGECCLFPEMGELSQTRLFALATNTVTAAGGVDLYLAHQDNFKEEDFIEVRGPAPDKWPPPPAEPDIDAQYANSVGAESATLKADINPNFWGDTSYQLQYGTEDCSGGGCADVLPQPRQLGAGIVKRDVTTDGIVLSGLTPGTTYHYRFVAESSGGGPVFGPDRTFTTFAAPEPTSGACPNQSFRTGPSAALADCRAYEMVSPLDKEGADLVVFVEISNKPARLEQATGSGEKITYSASTAFAGGAGGSYSSQYISTRGSAGWGTEAITPAHDSGSVYDSRDLDTPFKAFSEDLSSAWFMHGAEPILAPGAVPGFGNLYRRDNLSGEFEALSTVAPSGVPAKEFMPEPLGFSADGTRSFFRARGQFTGDASPNPLIEQLYEAHEGELKLVSVKPPPSNAAAAVSSNIGAPPSSFNNNREDNLDTAVSEDGRLVYWTEEGTVDKLYLRIEAAETTAVSGSKDAIFWRASPDGNRAIYTEGAEQSKKGGALKRFDAETRTSETLIAGGTVGVMGASDDLSRIYLASKEALTGGATAGEPNLYLYEDGAPLRFIATLDSEELPGTTETLVPPITLNPYYHLSRVTPDGQTAIFMSREALTGADNTDVATGNADAEVFRYDAGADELTCVSCLATGARPRGAELRFEVGEHSNYFYASKIPGWEMQFHAPRVLSEDGDRVFFNSVNRLTLTDTNGRQDVYEWEAEGKGECVDESSPGYVGASGGCLTQVSNAQSSTDSEFIDASADGRDVFFFTGTSLLPQDVGQIDIYDARVNGGFPQPPAPAAQCEGEACQSPVSPPSEPPYASQGYQGPGNPKPAAEKKQQKKKKKKAKHKRKGKAKQRAQQRLHHTANNTGGGR